MSNSQFVMGIIEDKHGGMPSCKPPNFHLVLKVIKWLEKDVELPKLGKGIFSFFCLNDGNEYREGSFQERMPSKGTFEVRRLERR
jgi:hypothetical protein